MGVKFFNTSRFVCGVDDAGGFVGYGGNWRLVIGWRIVSDEGEWGMQNCYYHEGHQEHEGLRDERNAEER
ncbi:MAG: hypothetical protein Fur0017_27910 [Anaerolineales bacterium]